MTLNITLATSRGIWQSSDHRLTVNGQPVDDYSIKHLSLTCQDGRALISYTGIGRVYDVDTSEWLRQVIRGVAHSIGETLTLIRDEATRTFGAIAPRNELTFNIGAIIRGHPWTVIITNLIIESSKTGPRCKVGTRFEIAALEVTDANAGVAGVLITGQRDAVSAKDLRLLKRAAQRKPRKPREYEDLLAAVNSRASKHGLYGKFISSSSLTSYMPVDGEGMQTRKHGAGHPREPKAVPIVFRGLDLTQLSQGTFDSLRTSGDAGERREIDRRFIEALGSTLIPQNPLLNRDNLPIPRPKPRRHG